MYLADVSTLKSQRFRDTCGCVEANPNFVLAKTGDTAGSLGVSIRYYDVICTKGKYSMQLKTLLVVNAQSTCTYTHMHAHAHKHTQNDNQILKEIRNNFKATGVTHELNDCIV
jgi:hypothetical protein